MPKEGFSRISRRTLYRRGVLACATVVLAAGSAMVASPSSLAATAFRLPKSPLSTGALVARAAHAGRIVPVVATDRSFTGRSSTILPNVQANTGTQPANETPITADPNNGQHLLTGANDYNCASLQGFHISTDGGATWSAHHCMAVLPGFQGFGDPAVGYDLSGNAYIVGIDRNGNGPWNIAFQKSTDNGSTWSNVAVSVPPFFTNGLTDKPWLEIDHGSTSRHPGAIYISVTQFNSSESQDVITVSHSYDGGATWSAPIQVDTVQNAASTVDQFSDLAVADDGTVYATWLRCPTTTGQCAGSNAKLLISRSTNGGAKWSRPVTVAKTTLAPNTCGAYYGCVPGTSERVSNIPSVDTNPSTGVLYVVYYTYTGATPFLQARVVKSIDGGGLWSAPTKPAGGNDTNDQWLPWLSVASNGWIGATWLERTAATTQFVVRAAVSEDGGQSWTSRKTTSNVTSNLANDGFNGGFIGDYTGSIWTGTTLHQAWPDTRTGTAADETGGLQP